MIFQFSDGEFSDPIATSLKMWKKKISFTHSSLAPPTRKLAARSLAKLELICYWFVHYNNQPASRHLHGGYMCEIEFDERIYLL